MEYSEFMASSERYLDLVETAYSFSEDPDQFEDLLTVATRYLFDDTDGVSIAQDLPRHLTEDSRLDSHLQRLSKILETTLADAQNSSAESSFYAQIRLAPGSKKVEGNAAANQLFGMDFPASLDTLPLDHRTLVLLKSFASRASQTETTRQQVLLGTVEEPELRTCLLSVSPSQDDDGIVVSFSYINWDDELLAHLANAFELTKKETEVLHGYLNRHSQKDIADRSNRSVETIKAQSKSILRKTGCSRMSDVVELSASIAYLLQKDRSGADAGTGSDWTAPNENIQFLDRPDGRKLAYYKHGKGDQAVIFLHGYILGPFFPKRFLKALEAENMMLIAPSRAGFGYSSPSASRKNYNQTVTDDHLALIEELGLNKVIIFAHQGGVSHAFRLAKALQDRVTTMVMVSAGVPIDDTRHVPNMDVHSRIGAVTARHAPSVLKFMTQLSLPIYKKQGAESFVRKFYADSPPDMRSVNDTETLPLLVQGVHHISQQGAETWVRDAQSAMGDWHDDFQSVSTYQLWIHGQKCPVLAAKFVEEYVSRYTNFPVEIIEDMGVTLFYQMPERIVELLRQAAAND